MVIMLAAAERPDPQIASVDVWTRRCLGLLLFGVAHFALFMWPGEILWTYGIAALALLAFRAARPRTLWIWAIIILVGLSAFRAYDTSRYVSTYEIALTAERAQQSGRPLTTERQNALASVAEARAANYPPPSAVAEQVAQRTALPSLIAWSASGWAARHLGVYSWLGVAESLAFMLVGMALFRSGIITGGASKRVYSGLLILGAIGLGLRLFDLFWQARTAFELDIHRVVPAMSLARSAWYQPARLALTLGYVALLVLLLKGGIRSWTPPFRIMGRTALTTYTLQSILASVLFYGFGFLGVFSFAELMMVTAAICLITAFFSLIWLKLFSMGPAEWLLRALAYGSFSPGRRTSEGQILAPSPSL